MSRDASEIGPDGPAEVPFLSGRQRVEKRGIVSMLTIPHLFAGTKGIPRPRASPPLASPGLSVVPGMRRALEPSTEMNAIYFGCKRAFHSFLRLTRGAFEGLGLTAARFDLLTAIDRHPCGTYQNDLRRMLGVSAPTVSRMLRSLEQLGLVLRERVPQDRRLRHVTLSEKGLALLRRATEVFIGSGAIQLAVDSALTCGRAYSESECLIECDIAESVFRRLRHAFHDSAHLRYPWHPDD